MNTFGGGFRQVATDVGVQVIGEVITALYRRFPVLRLHMEFRLYLEREEADRELRRQLMIARAHDQKHYDA